VSIDGYSGRRKPSPGQLIDHRPQQIEISVGIQEGARFVTNPELSPGPLFEYFFEAADAAGQSDKSVCQLRHFGLALVHGGDDVQFADGVMLNLAVRE
jgi:hypothetical protein